MILDVALILFALWAVGCFVLAAAHKFRLLVFGMPMAFCALGAWLEYESVPPTTGSEARLDMAGQALIVLYFVTISLVCVPIWLISGKIRFDARGTAKGIQ
jgi:hypothetical protein